MVSQLSLHWFFPQSATIDKENFTKVKVTVYGLCFVIVACFLLTLVRIFFNINSELPFVTLLMASAVLLIIFKYTSSFLIIGNILGAALTLALLPLSLKTGGIYSEDIHSLFLVPMLVMVVAGYRSGLFWFVIMVLWVTYVTYLCQDGEQLEIFRTQTLTFDLQYYLGIIVVNLFIPFVLYYLLNVQYKKLIVKFQKSEKVLENKNEVYAIQAKELERTQKELKRSNTELEQYAHVTSHDLKQPICTINGLATLLNMHLDANQLQDEESAKYVNLIIDTSKNMNILVGDLLAYAKLGSLKEIAFEKQSINKILDNVLLNLKNQTESNEVVIVRSEMPTLDVIPVKINQLFQNIISNAIKFKKFDVPSIIHISAEELSTRYKFSIKDNGIGIDKRYKEKIFTPFTKLHNESDYSGSGIGLATCKRIIELHNGKIWVDSVKGEGTTFHFTLQK